MISIFLNMLRLIKAATVYEPAEFVITHTSKIAPNYEQMASECRCYHQPMSAPQQQPEASNLQEDQNNDVFHHLFSPADESGSSENIQTIPEQQSDGNIPPLITQNQEVDAPEYIPVYVESGEYNDPIEFDKEMRDSGHYEWGHAKLFEHKICERCLLKKIEECVARPTNFLKIKHSCCGQLMSYRRLVKYIVSAIISSPGIPNYSVGKYQTIGQLIVLLIREFGPHVFIYNLGIDNKINLKKFVKNIQPFTKDHEDPNIRVISFDFVTISQLELDKDSIAKAKNVFEKEVFKTVDELYIASLLFEEHRSNSNLFKVIIGMHTQRVRTMDQYCIAYMMFILDSPNVPIGFAMQYLTPCISGVLKCSEMMRIYTDVYTSTNCKTVDTKEELLLESAFRLEYKFKHKSKSHYNYISNYVWHSKNTSNRILNFILRNSKYCLEESHIKDNLQEMMIKIMQNVCVPINSKNEKLHLIELLKIEKVIKSYPFLRTTAVNLRSNAIIEKKIDINDLIEEIRAAIVLNTANRKYASFDGGFIAVSMSTSENKTKFIRTICDNLSTIEAKQFYLPEMVEHKIIAPNKTSGFEKIQNDQQKLMYVGGLLFYLIRTIVSDGENKDIPKMMDVLKKVMEKYRDKFVELVNGPENQYPLIVLGGFMAYKYFIQLKYPEKYTACRIDLPPMDDDVYIHSFNSMCQELVNCTSEVCRGDMDSTITAYLQYFCGEGMHQLTDSERTIGRFVKSVLGINDSIMRVYTKYFDCNDAFCDLLMRNYIDFKLIALYRRVREIAPNKQFVEWGNAFNSAYFPSAFGTLQGAMDMLVPVVHYVFSSTQIFNDENQIATDLVFYHIKNQIVSRSASAAVREHGNACGPDVFNNQSKMTLFTLEKLFNINQLANLVALS